MTGDPISRLEYESMVFERHLTMLPGRARRGSVLDQSAYTLLSLLSAGGPSTIAELRAITGLDASTLNRQTAALTRNGYAERVVDPKGGPAKKFVMTKLGRETLEEERAACRDALAELLDEWSDDDQEAIASLLAHFNRSIESKAGRSWPRPSAERREYTHAR